MILLPCCRGQLQVPLHGLPARQGGEQFVDDAVDQPAVPEEDPGHQGDVVHEEDAVVVDKDGGTTAGYLLHAEHLVVVVVLGDVGEAGGGPL